MPICTCCGTSTETHKSVNCCVCSKPYKTDCVNVSNAEVRKINQKCGFTWTCKNCIEYGNDLNSIKNLLAALQDEMKTLKESFMQSSSSPKHSLLESEKIIQEITEREKRKNNIVIFGSDESNCNSNNEQIDIDVLLIKDVCSVLQVSENNFKISRMGKFDSSQVDRRRPIKVTFPVESCVIAALRNVSKLKTHARFSHLSVFRDRTPMQIQIHKEAKAELNNRISNGEQNLRIKYERGIPKIVPSLN